MISSTLSELIVWLLAVTFKQLTLTVPLLSGIGYRQQWSSPADQHQIWFIIEILFAFTFSEEGGSWVYLSFSFVVAQIDKFVFLALYKDSSPVDGGLHNLTVNLWYEWRQVLLCGYVGHDRSNYTRLIFLLLVDEMCYLGIRFELILRNQ